MRKPKFKRMFSDKSKSDLHQDILSFSPDFFPHYNTISIVSIFCRGGKSPIMDNFPNYNKVIYFKHRLYFLAATTEHTLHIILIINYSKCLFFNSDSV